MNIIIQNSFCTLVDFPATIIEQVKAKLTYTNEEVILQKQTLYYQMRRVNGPYREVLMAKFQALGPDQVCLLVGNQFPTGLLHIVYPTIVDSKYDIIDKRVKPELEHIFRWNNIPPPARYYQTEAVDAFLAKGRGVLQMAVGVGKTLVATNIIKQLGVTTLFVVPSSALLTQAHDVFALAFGQKIVQNITSNDIKKGKKLKPIRVVTIQTIASLFKQGILYILLNDVGLIINDEVHHSASMSYVSLLKSIEGIYYRLGLSGTYMRNDSKTLDLWGVSGEVVYNYPADRATKEGYLCPVEFNIVKVDGKYNIKYQDEYRDNYSSIKFLDSVSNIVKNIPQDKSVLILVDRKANCGKLIHEYLKEQGITATYITGDNTKDEVRDAMESFNAKSIHILIASAVLGEGCDLKSTDCLLMCKGGKSEIVFTQSVGRAVRLFPGKKIATVWDFHFQGCRYLPRHLDQRIDIYKKQFNGQVNFLG